MSTKAKAQRFPRARIGDIISQERAALSCGCAIYVGRTAAEGKAATAATPCCEEHQLITDRASGLLRERLTRRAPGKLLVETCREVLTVAARQLG